MSLPRFSGLLPTLAAVLLAGGCALAQVDPRPEPAVPVIAQASLTEDELGRPIAIGPNWECEFDATGARFLPVLGNRSPVLMDLRLRATSLRRGAAEVAFADEAAPIVTGNRVGYRRAAGVVERFDAKPLGLEHSLVLERPVGGSGDLVVTIALGGNAAAHGKPTADGGLCFSQGQGGVDYGALTAIDASGDRCAGTVRLVSGAIEWVVPAAFVEQATYPLVLDPLVGSNFSVTLPNGGPFQGPWQTDADADVAYDATNDVHLVVWRRNYSSGGASQSSIRAQRLDGNGVSLGSVLAVSLVDTSTSPCVANVNLSNRFVVGFVYRDFFGTSQVRARAVAASDGTMSSTALITSQNVGDVSTCDVAGESATGSIGSLVVAQAWIVWMSASQGLRGARISVPTGSTSLSVAGTFGVASAAPEQLMPRISRAPTTEGRLGIAWLNGGLTGLNMQVRVAVIDRSGAVVNGATQVFSQPALSATPPTIDGGGSAVGSEFVVAFESATPLFGNNYLYTLHAIPLTSSAQLVVGAPVMLASETNNGHWPTVGWRSGKAYVAYSKLLNTQIVLRGVDPRTCQTCEPETLVMQVSGAQVSRPSICMDRTGGSNSASTGLLVWDQQSNAIFEGSILGRFLDAFSPNATTSNLGGGCGSGGTTTTNSPPAVGNSTFGLRLQGAGSGSLLAILNWNSPQPLLGCGPCQWLPFGGTITTLVTNGAAEAALPIPCDASLSGVPLDTQWTVWRPGTAPCPIVPDFVLSNALRLHIH